MNVTLDEDDDSEDEVASQVKSIRREQKGLWVGLSGGDQNETETLNQDSSRGPDQYYQRHVEVKELEIN